MPSPQTAANEPTLAASTHGPVITGPDADHGSQLSIRRLNMMRLGYLLIGIGLMVAEWPLLLDAHAAPVMQGVVTCLMTALSLMALLGLRYPVRMLPILLFETTWKLVWIAAVAIPHMLADDMDEATSEVLFNVSFVALIIAVIPWRYSWRILTTKPAERWR